MDAELVETWKINARVNLYLLDAVPDDALNLALPKCRSVSSLFTHIHNVRLMWLKSAAPEALEGLEKLETKTVATKDQLRQALEASGVAVEAIFHKASAAGGKIKGFKPHATAFLGYLVAHESHHRGHIGWTLKLSGRPLDQKTSFGLWEWGVR